MPGMGRVVEALLAMSMPSWRDGGYRRSLSAKLGMGEGNCCRSLQRVDALDRTGSGKTPPGCGLHNAPSPAVVPTQPSGLPLSPSPRPCSTQQLALLAPQLRPELRSEDASSPSTVPRLPRAALCSRLYRPGEWKNPTPDL